MNWYFTIEIRNYLDLLKLNMQMAAFNSNSTGDTKK